jgi:hypothetical protein
MNLLELVKDNQIIILVCVTAIGLLLIWNIILSVSLSRLKGEGTDAESRNNSPKRTN